MPDRRGVAQSQRNRRDASSGVTSAQAASTIHDRPGCSAGVAERVAEHVGERARRQRVGDGTDRPGQLGERDDHPAEQQQHEVQAVLARRG